MDTIKVFISQPMRGKTLEEITQEREKIIETMIEYQDGSAKIEIIDSVFKEQSTPVNDLGKSLQLLSQADVAIFAEGWENANGCSIEHLVCEKYDITIGHCSKTDKGMDIFIMGEPKPLY